MMKEKRFEELLQLLLDDEIVDDQMDELTQMVSANDELLMQLRQHLMMSDRLSQYEDELRSDDRFVDSLEVRANASEDSGAFIQQVIASANREAPPQSTPVRLPNTATAWQMSRSMAGWVTAAVATLILVVVLWQHDGKPENHNFNIPAVTSVKNVETDTGVAVLTQVSGLMGSQTKNWAVGNTIPPGPFSWDTGLLQLEFYGGTTVVAEGPASLDILSDSRVACHSGRLRVQVPEPARGFVVMAPSVELVNVGTEFGIDVEADGTTEVHVFDGNLELYDANSDRNIKTRRELEAGNAVAVQPNGELKPIRVRETEFATPIRMSAMAETQRQQRLGDWEAFRESLQNDPRVVAYFPFDRDTTDDRRLIGYGVDGEMLDGAIVGCEWSQGRWPDKTSLQFKRPGDRVRITIPGEFRSLTYSAWLRVDGLDREFNSLLLTDGWETNALHWQIGRVGKLILGVNHRKNFQNDYRTGTIVGPFGLGKWMNLATIYDQDASTIRHYCNGERLSNEAVRLPSSAPLAIGNATIGNWSFPSEWVAEDDRQRTRRIRSLNGCIDEIIVFGQALTDQEIHQVYEAGRP
ncbi:LamG-like jellyroll fold domain-containing protein [Neorhodopirellula lusitana]|uniref:LamG-like jellyroll fold domain-containing protein n=1 Tax=Neorhodopirellula lusitana TaxID=445327 RepID=UPI00384E8F66